MKVDRDYLGQVVRRAWVKWAAEQPSPKASWLIPWEELPEPDREVDRQIGEAVVTEETNLQASSLVVQLGWEWEGFERDARNASTSVLLETLKTLDSPPTGDDRNDMLATAASAWIKKEIAWRNGSVWTTRAPAQEVAPPVSPGLASEPCRGCGKPLAQTSWSNRLADGCECNSPRGVNHGLVPAKTCTCKECDPDESGSSRNVNGDPK